MIFRDNNGDYDDVLKVNDYNNLLSLPCNKLWFDPKKKVYSLSELKFSLLGFC